MERREPGYDFCFFHQTYRYCARCEHSHRGYTSVTVKNSTGSASNSVTFTISCAADHQFTQSNLRHSRRPAVHVDREWHKFRRNFDRELERNRVGHDVCFCHTTHGHRPSRPYRHCWHRLDHCCKLRGNIKRADIYDCGDAGDHQPAHGVWDSRGCLLLHDYSNQQPNHIHRKPAACRPECEYEHGRDFGNTDNGRNN